MIDAFFNEWKHLQEVCQSNNYTLEEKIDFAYNRKDYLIKLFHPSEVERLYLPRFDNLISQLKSEKDRRKKKEKTSITSKSATKNNCLKDIWQKDRDGNLTYNSIIERLKQENPKIGGSFINVSPDGLHWNETIKGDRQYLAAFIYQMTVKKWIATWYSAPEYVRILYNTFLFKKCPNPEPFKGLHGAPPDDKYQEPFKNYPINI